jgi:hypothetical protein
MCFSPEASLLSFTVGIAGSLLCISLGSIKDRIVGYFFGFVSLMQGIEYLLWMNQTCDIYNRIISFLGMVLNHLQPLVLGFIILLINKNTGNKRLIYLLMLAYLLVIVPYSLQFFSVEKEKKCTLKNKENHLNWNWNLLKYNRIIYLFFLFTMSALFLIGLPSLKSGRHFALGAILTYTTSGIIYTNNNVGALWCYYTAFFPLIYYFLTILF